MRLLNVLIALLCAGCVNVSCRPDFVVHAWTGPDGAPESHTGQLTVPQQFAEIESISFITCDYDD
jgi:hypothetical protein